MNFIVIGRGQKEPVAVFGREAVYLRADRWNDYSFVTMFYLSMHDKNGDYHEFGNIKIGFSGQTIDQLTSEKIGEAFNALPVGFFSLGMDVNYYKKLMSLPEGVRKEILTSLRDVVADSEALSTALNEDVFNVSLLRTVSISVVNNQFARVLAGGAPLTDFKFVYNRSVQNCVIDLSFDVVAESKPSTNIHALIGRNGVGKTTILNDMILSVLCDKSAKGKLFEKTGLMEVVDKDYFSNLVSVSFSAFDSFSPPKGQTNPVQGVCYYYIGLRGGGKSGDLKSLSDLHDEFVDSVSICCSQQAKKDRWVRAINGLESDKSFSEMNSVSLASLPEGNLRINARKCIQNMSSGHAIIMLTITKLIATVEEKTLVLIDEPESHLHPPLLSAFIRALSELLHDRNGVAIVATHSPVVLQEIPSSCVWKINRIKDVVKNSRPDVETFGENVGVLTREVFGLEVVASGFHKMLLQSVKDGCGYDEILSSYDGQLGFEARAILRAMIASRDEGGFNEKDKSTWV